MTDLCLIISSRLHSSNQRGCRKSQATREFDKRRQTGITITPLDAAYIIAMQLGETGQILLTHAKRFASLAHVNTQGFENFRITFHPTVLATRPRSSPDTIVVMVYAHLRRSADGIGIVQSQKRANLV